MIANAFKFEYSRYVGTTSDYIGKQVKVVKGRKYPIGNTYTIKGFTRWAKDGSYGHISTDYAIMTTGEKINIHNLELVKPKVHHEEVKRYCNHGEPCPVCNHLERTWNGESFDPISDYYYQHETCKYCYTHLYYV